MLRNYFRSAWRHLTRNKAHAFVNIAGLSVGLACALLITLWIENETNVDHFPPAGSRLYTVYERQYFDNKVRGQYSTPGVLAEEIKRSFPSVQYAVNAWFNSGAVFRNDDKIIEMQGGAAGADFFKMFSYPFVEGNASTALSTPSSIAISRKMAQAFYGSPQAAIGKAIRYNSERNFTVTAVFEDVGVNSSRKFDYLLNWTAFQDLVPSAKSWQNNWPETFVMLTPDARVLPFQRELTHFMDAYVTGQKKGVFTVQLGIQPFGDSYLHNHFEEDGNPRGGAIEFVRLFGVIAAFILLMACINFTNLATARSVKRAREIGVRKVVGAQRATLVAQFIGESVFTALLAAAIAIVLLAALLPLFNTVTQKQIGLPFHQWRFWVEVLAITILTGLTAGVYPAVFLSSFQPVRVLKGAFRLDRTTNLFRRGLVTFQFTLSVVIITGTIVIARQIDYIQSRNSGFDRENLLYLPAEGNLSSHYNAFKVQASTMPGIQSISFTNSTPTYIDNGTEDVSWSGKDPNQQVRFLQTGVGYDFANTLHLQLLAGRDFSRDFPLDTGGYLLNEAALKETGYKEAIGKPFSLWGQKGKIIGVLKDFHMNSLHERILPLVVWFDARKQYGNILVRTQPGQTSAALASLQVLCRRFNPEDPFSYSFADEEYRKLYQDDRIVSKLSLAFATLAVFIACLGLLGLAMFTAEQRFKEIGIRKVLGASVTSLFRMLSSELLILIVIALLVGSPLAWFGIRHWLDNFAYHATLPWWLFGLSAGLVLVIALATISFQVVKATLINPVKSLRSE